MFLGVASDSSTVSRTSSYHTAFTVASHYLPIGRGYGTFLPQYRVLDNTYLLMFIELGIIGTIAFLALIVTAMVVAARALARSTMVATRELIAALVAAILTVSTTFAFFDALSFAMSAGTMFLLMGLCGAVANCVDVKSRRWTATASVEHPAI